MSIQSSAEPPRPIAVDGTRAADVVSGQLEALIAWSGLSIDHANKTRDAYRILSRNALDRSVAGRYDGLSRINPDGLPFQWSFCIDGGGPSVRFLCEVGPPGSSVEERLRLSQVALAQALEALGIPRPSWLWEDVIPTVFAAPDSLPPRWLSAMWFAVEANQRHVLLKVYINLEHGSPRERWERVGRVLLDLGRRESLKKLCELSRPASRDSWPIGLALDVLGDGRPGRVKAYFYGDEVGPEWLYRWYAAAGLTSEIPYVRTTLASFPWHADRPYWIKSLFISPEFGPRGKLTLKTDLAVSRWVRSDALILRGVHQLAARLGLDVSSYVKALRTIGDWPVSRSQTRTHHVVGLGFEGHRRRHLNVYCEPRMKRSNSDQ